MNNEVYEGVDVYTKDYDYEDVKVAICVANRLSDWNLYTDFEYIARLVIFIKDNWCVDKYDGNLSEEDFGYIQNYAYKLLDELKNKIMEELQ